MQVRNLSSATILALALVTWLGANQGFERGIQAVEQKLAAAEQKMAEGKVYLAVLFGEQGAGRDASVFMAGANAEQTEILARAEAQVASETALENAQCARKQALANANHEVVRRLAEMRIQFNAGLRERIMKDVSAREVVLVREAMSRVPHQIGVHLHDVTVNDAHVNGVTVSDDGSDMIELPEAPPVQ